MRSIFSMTLIIIAVIFIVLPAGNSFAQCPVFDKAEVVAYRQSNLVKNGTIKVINNFDFLVKVLLYHSDSPEKPFSTYSIVPGFSNFLLWDNKNLALANDWGIQLILPDGQKTCVLFVGKVGNIVDNTYVLDCKKMVISNPSGSLKIQGNSSFIDPRDGKTYEIVRIGTQVWMAQNLDYKSLGMGWCYDNNPENCRKYGTLYTWQEAQRTCPSGWHLPDKLEFESLLFNCEGGYYDLIKGGESGFSSVNAGWRGTGGGFGALGDRTNFWTTTETGNSSAWVLGINSSESKAELVNSAAKVCGFSVRCVKD